MAKVLVTGPTGPAGQYVLERLMTTGHEVRVLALPDSMHRMNFRDRIDVVLGHLGDPIALQEALDGVKIVFHTALVSPPPALTPEQMMQTNALGTAALVKAAWGRVERFVLISSNNVYTPHRSPAVWPLRDDAPRMAHGNQQQVALGESLIAAEDAVFDAAEQGAFEHVTLRPTVIAGRSSSFIDQMVTGIIRGNSNLDMQRRMWDTMQWVHGADLARAAILLSEHPDAANTCFLVAGDTPVTVYDVQAMIWDLMNIGRDGNPFLDMAARNNIGLRKFDNSRLRSFGWVPEFGMRECLSESLGRLEFHSSNSLRLPLHMIDA
jgi:nucleoside-diphosphate-sugar epimerase